MIEASARTTKDGSSVRERLMNQSVAFGYDGERYGKALED